MFIVEDILKLKEHKSSQNKSSYLKGKKKTLLNISTRSEKFYR